MRIGIFKEQGPRTDGFGQVSHHLAMRVDGTADKTAAVGIQDHPIVDGTFRENPHRGDSASIHFDVVDTAGLGRQSWPMDVIPLDLFLRPQRSLGHDRCQRLIVLFVR
jgi:hypothetical protein